MTFKISFALCVGLCFSAAISAQPLRSLDDAELSQVDAADGISIAMHLVLNDQTLNGPVTDSRLSYGFDVNGKKTYVVLKNLSGTIDMFALNLSVNKKPDGTDYVAVTLPSYVKYTNLGFESLSVQADPLAPVTESLGRFNLNGNMSMQGELRIWAH